MLKLNSLCCTYALTTLLVCSVNFSSSANILGVFPVASFSHQVVFQSLSTELSLRGHQVTVLTPLPLNNASLTNLTEHYLDKISISTHFGPTTLQNDNMFKLFKNIVRIVQFLTEVSLNNTNFQKTVFNDKERFDLILLECIDPAFYALAEIFNAPIICISSLGSLTVTYSVVGNPSHPILNPDFIVPFDVRTAFVWQKMHLTMYNIWSRFYYNYISSQCSNNLVEKYFGKHNHTYRIQELGKNVIMYFLNVNPILHNPRPNVPAVVETGQLQVRRATSLSPDLQKFLDNAKNGSIYISFGTTLFLENSTFGNIFLEIIRQLPYNFVIKWKSLKNSTNTFSKEWLPQQDILAHPNIRAFVFQGGLQSMEEAISREVPMIGIPFITDQSSNVQKIVDLGIGIRLDPTNLKKECVKTAISEIVENEKYRKKIKVIKRVLYDKPISGLENAIWWVEYASRNRHKYMKNLKTVRVEYSWFHFLLLDVILTVIITFILFVYCIWKLYCFIFRNYR